LTVTENNSKLSGYDAFCIFTAVYLHFNDDSYDYWKYKGHVKAKKESFTLRKDRYSFIKLGRMYNEFELPYFLACNHYHGDKGMWIRNFDGAEAKMVYSKWLHRQNTRPQLLQETLTKLGDLRPMLPRVGQEYPKLLAKVMGGEVSAEVLVILDHFFNLIEGWDQSLGEDFAWTTFKHKFLRYKPFITNYTVFDTTQFKQIISTHNASITDSSRINNE
jgi:hypothetical protein